MTWSKRLPIVLMNTDRECRECTRDHPLSHCKHAWRKHVILALGLGCVLVATMRRTGKSRPTVSGQELDPDAGAEMQNNQ